MGTSHSDPEERLVGPPGAREREILSQMALRSASRTILASGGSWAVRLGGVAQTRQVSENLPGLPQETGK